MIAFDGFGFSIEGSGFRVQNLRLGFYVLGAGSSMYGSGFWVREPCCSLLFLLLTTLKFTETMPGMRACVYVCTQTYTQHICTTRIYQRQCCTATPNIIRCVFTCKR